MDNTEQFVLIPQSLWEQKSKNLGQSTSETPRKVFWDSSKARQELDENSKLQEQQQDDRIIKKFVGNSTEKKNSTQILKYMHENPIITFSNDDTIMLDNGDTGIVIEKFINDLHRDATKIPGIYFNVLDYLKLPLSLVTNKYALSENRGDWITV